MVNVLMSQRTKEDYTAVFRELIKSLNEDLKLEECVLNFELEAWVSLREVFPDVHSHGCQLHCAHPYSSSILNRFHVQNLSLSVHIPLEFLISDIRMEDQEGKLVARHIILASPEQMKFLRNADSTRV